MNLLACSSCRRQLNVTALQPGDGVRCACGALLSVGVPKDVKVSGLFCSRCGGKVTATDEACSFCQAALDEKDRQESLLCPECFQRLPDDTRHCNACGVRLRATALPPLPRDGHCPGCKGDLRLLVTDETELVECESCGGLWCCNETFQRLRAGAAGSPAGGVKASVKPLSLTDDSRDGGGQRPMYLPCLSCGELMLRRQFRIQDRPSRVVLDFCKDHGTWFDSDELRDVLAFVRQEQSTGHWGSGASSLRRMQAKKTGAELSLQGRSQWFKPKEWGGDLLADVLTVLSFSLFD
ncbi:MAG: hypothetical protein ACI8QC_001420 [Planctomycetota bacterium]